MAARELTNAEFRALQEAITVQDVELRQQVAEFERLVQVVMAYPTAGSPAWSDATRDINRATLYTALHAAATRAVVAATAMHDAAASVVTAWTP